MSGHNHGNFFADIENLGSVSGAVVLDAAKYGMHKLTVSSAITSLTFSGGFEGQTNTVVMTCGALAALVTYGSGIHADTATVLLTALKKTVFNFTLIDGEWVVTGAPVLLT